MQDVCRTRGVLWVWIEEVGIDSERSGQRISAGLKGAKAARQWMRAVRLIRLGCGLGG